MTEPRARALYARLRDDLIAGVYPPGERLSELSVSARYGVSRTPTREALSRLEGIGLLERQGSHLAVPKPTVEDILDLFDARTLLEAAIAGYAAERRREGDILVLQAAAERCESLGAQASVSDRYLANREFHHALSSAAHNTILTDQQGQLDLRVAALRATTLTRPGRAEEAGRQHQEIVAAVIERDKERASSAADRHMRDARELWRDLLRRGRVPGTGPI